MKENYIMKHRKTQFTATRLALCFLALGYFAFPQRSQAVSPPPDGGYSGGNTAEGPNALCSLLRGVGYNTANGYAALYHNTIGSYNTATGCETLYDKASGIRNTADG